MNKDANERILQEMLDADKDSPRLIQWTNETMLEQVKTYEIIYSKPTSVFLKEFVEDELEGNVDKHNWYRFACILMEEGYSFQ